VTFFPLEKLHRLYDGYIRAFKVAGVDLLLLQSEGQAYLIANRCPHMQAPLTYASLKQNLLRCPLHGIEFDLISGRARGGCPAPLQKFPITYEGNQLGVVLNAN
jgi:nitrite reductase/ring-hydroxylating ferredoxin subunit